MVNQVPCSDVQTISALNNFSGMDERDHIDLMNSYLNVISHPVYVNTNPNESFELIKFAIKHNDMPIADFSNVAHLLLMKKAQWVSRLYYQDKMMNCFIIIKNTWVFMHKIY